MFLSRGLGRWGVFLPLLALLGLSGCEGTATVSGKVLYKGVPLKGGNVTFASTEGRRSVATSINEDGTYTIQKVPAGAVTICVETESLNPALKRTARKYSPPPGQKAPGGFGSGNTEDTAKRFVPIPPQYAEPESSDLKYTVASGTQTKDIELK
jgi:hypothetical protein